MAANQRRRSVAVRIGSVEVGGPNPIVVQSMTNTDTADVQSTVNQVMALANAGSELVRVTVNTEDAAAAVPKLVDTLDKFETIVDGDVILRMSTTEVVVKQVARTVGSEVGRAIVRGLLGSLGGKK